MARRLCMIVGAAAVAIAAASSAAPAGAEPTVPQIPTEYRQALVDAGTTCSQVDAPLLAGYLADASRFDATAVSAAGMISAGQVPPTLWQKYARPGEVPTDAEASTHVTARYMCAIADDVDKAAPSTSTPRDKAIMLLVVINAGGSALPYLTGSSSGADGAATTAIQLSTEYATRVLDLRDEYRKQGI